MGTRIGATADIPDGSRAIVDVAGKKIAVFNVGGKFFAIDNACKHRGGPLGDGELDGTNVTCPWHGWEYDITTGANLDEPSIKVGCYVVKVEGDDLVIET